MSIRAGKFCLTILLLLLSCAIPSLAMSSSSSSSSSSLRGNGQQLPTQTVEHKGHRVVLSTIGENDELISSKQMGDKDNEKIKEISKEEDMERELAASAFAQLFATPIAQWTLAQWGLLFIILWLVGYFMRRCTCLYDILACYCCYEIFCDPDPVGFVAC